MNYEQQDFLDLISEVERQGGELLERRCQGRTIRQQSGSGIQAYTANTTGCRKQSMFDVMYLEDHQVKMGDPGRFKPIPRPRKHIERTGGFSTTTEPQFATVCAIDDSMGLWPRFQHVVSDASFEDQ